MYVDDIVVIRNDFIEIKKSKSYFAAEFEIKDLGSFRYFLRIEDTRSKQGIFLYTTKYVLDLLKGIGLLGCKPVYTPIEANHKLADTKEDPPSDRVMYQRMVIA